MGGRAADGADLRRFLTVLALTSIIAAAVGRFWGAEIADALERTATTETGWLLLGWLLSGPPVLFAALAWHDRRRLGSRQRRSLSRYLAVWIGLSMLLLPAMIHGPDRYFGTADSVVEPLSTGWAWGALANLVGMAFAGIVLLVLHRSVAGRPSKRQVALTARFVELGWALVLAVSLSLALYGGTRTVVAMVDTRPVTAQNH